MNFIIKESPAGPLALAGDDQALRLLLFANGSRGTSGRFAERLRVRGGMREVLCVDGEVWEEADRGAVREASRELDAYFARKLRRFEVPVEPQGTPFQLTVWNELRKIPYGETISYGELARRVGNPAASRAVGLANGSNPIAIVIPCHRVIGSNGKLTGFGGGLAVKKRLLDLEAPPSLFD